jgi:diaminohydroxyphosphoribosylaminopyrimidine deaminase / 5-amino-6-(5-phosphoribosylamino)uracil reductase
VTERQDAVDGLQSAFAAILAAARRVEGRTSPNPPVGAAVVRDGRIIAVGATEPAGGRHAEVVALQAAGAAAAGADLYTTLEPCTFHGRTPPCTDAIAAAGIRRVFYVARDDDPRMGPGAAAVLAARGVAVQRISDDDGQVSELLAPFFCRVRLGRPLVTAKYAMTLDGRMATADGDSQWISSEPSRVWVHQLRDRVDALMVGSGTLLRDNPQLTTRLAQHSRPPRSPLRVIVDSLGRTPLGAQVLSRELARGTLIAAVRVPAAWYAEVRARGGEVVLLPAAPDGRVDLTALLQELARRGVNHLLVEGGPTLLGALADVPAIDRIAAFIAPKLIGAVRAPAPFQGIGVTSIAAAAQWRLRRIERSGDDALLLAEPTQPAWLPEEETS